MLRLLLFLLFCPLFLLGVNAATVDIRVEMSNDKALFTYQISFADDEEFSSFSFEKPQESKILLSQYVSGEKLRYSTAGDYFIFRPDGTKGKSFSVTFESLEGPKELSSEQSFSNYVNFNFPVSQLNYTLTFKDSFGEVQELFPRTFQILEDGSYFWEIENPTNDTFFLVTFPREEKEFMTYLLSPFVWISSFSLLLLIVFVLLFLLMRKKRREKKVLDKKEKKESQKELSGTPDTKEDEALSTESFDEIIEKYLTESEREVVQVVKTNKGISQYDILNFLPMMTKSNLSKIISKLHARKFLSRIKVGKVNKIYLGDKLETKK